MKKLFLFFMLIFNTYFIFSTQPQLTNTNEIENAIVEVLAVTNTKTDYREEQKRINKVVSYGNAAVPFLIQTLKKVEDRKSWNIIKCLCEISSEDSLKFVREILQEHIGRDATTASIRNYPVQREDEIITLLIELLKVQEQRWDASERLREMIYRKPSRAGILVETLKDGHSYKEFDYQLWDILAWVSSYHHDWGASSLVSGNNFWREWWSRNRDKDVFGWLLETYNSGYPSRKKNSLQNMAVLGDKRAIPYLVAALDDESNYVRYYAVNGLKKFNNTYPEGGYLWETFLNEEKEVIQELKNEFSEFGDIYFEHK